MTRNAFLFKDGTALVDGIEVDALGGASELPFLNNAVRVAAARAALSDDDWNAAESVSNRGVLSSGEIEILVLFVSPPDWGRFGPALWDGETGLAHSVFRSSTMLVDGIAVQGCAGLPFGNSELRRDCAIWCLKNGLDDLAEVVCRTPSGGPGPYCTWPETDIQAVLGPTPASCRAVEAPIDLNDLEVEGGENQPRHASLDEKTNVVKLFGDVICPLDN